MEAHSGKLEQIVDSLTGSGIRLESTLTVKWSRYFISIVSASSTSATDVEDEETVVEEEEEVVEMEEVEVAARGEGLSADLIISKNEGKF